MSIHLEIIEKDGKKQVVLPYDEFIRMQQALQDFADLKMLRQERGNFRKRTHAATGRHS